MWIWFAVIPWPDLTLIFHGICLLVTLLTFIGGPFLEETGQNVEILV